MTSIAEKNFIVGTFKEELRNRFLCRVCINGMDVTCYIPSSCRLSNFINLIGRTVLLTPNTSPSARTPYAVYAMKYGRRYILLNLAQANRIIEAQLHRRYFSFLGKRKRVFREVKIGEYKADLFIEDTNTIIEIKSILSFDNSAVFPAIYSERAISQLEVISKLLIDGYKVCYLLVSLNPKVNELRINRNMADFYNIFQTCLHNGMIVHGVSLCMTDYFPKICSNVRVII